MKHSENTETRRSFLLKAYVAPAILTLTAAPAFATYGSPQDKYDKKGSDSDSDRNSDWNWGRGKGRGNGSDD